MGGALLLIGGHEDKEDEPSILQTLVERIGSGTLVVTTVASEVPDDLWATYVEAFRKLGLERVVHLPLGSREQARSEESARLLDGAVGVFFTGGDRLPTLPGRAPLAGRTMASAWAGSSSLMASQAPGSRPS